MYVPLALLYYLDNYLDNNWIRITTSSTHLLYTYLIHVTCER